MPLPPLEDEDDGGPADAGLIRLQKVLARAGFGSRRVCDDLIGDHQVTVNGEVAELGRRVDPEVDEVAVHGVRIGVRPGTVWYLLNKPTGVVTTADDPQGRPTVVSMVPEEPRVFPVGRLDLDTEGLLLLTNDGDVTHRLTHPSFGVEKEYLAEVQGEPSRGTLRRLRTGIELEDGMTAPAKASLVAAGADGTSQVRLTIHEGRNRQVRRMADAVGHPVVRLIRTRIGPLTDPDLGPGAWRALTIEEVRALERAVAAAESAADAEPDIEVESDGPAGGAPASEGLVAPDSPAADDEPPR
jgi:23S rRNA pseudouridine2605 synthase